MNTNFTHAGLLERSLEFDHVVNFSFTELQKMGCAVKICGSRFAGTVKMRAVSAFLAQSQECFFGSIALL